MSPRAGLVIGLVAAFLIGAAAGLMGGILFARGVILHQHFGERAERGGRGERFGRGPRMMLGPPPEMMVRGLRDRLHLTDAQAESILVVLKSSRSDAAAARETIRVRIERRLTIVQRAQFDKMQRHFPGPDGPRDPRRGPHGPEPGSEEEDRP